MTRLAGADLAHRPPAGTGTSTHALSRALAARRPVVCGILNVTPDSFSDGGRFHGLEAAVEHGCTLAADGADLIDIGGESTRPGSRPPTLAEEPDRVVPVVEALVGQVPVPLSVDTSRPEVMRAAVAAGASMVNDVRALQWPGALQAAAQLGVPVCLMHMQGSPETMQTDPHYRDVVAEVRTFLAERIVACLDAGIRPEHLVVDPGFGFGKTLTHTVALLASLDAFTGPGVPVMVGLSRKSVLGQLTGRTVGDRLPGSLAAALVAVQRGASVLRVHDVAATRDVVAVLDAVGTR
ncbi:dihydropteroate synthase [Geodermatophilus maliterrae]|uniref:Dihydropteroate synthase n=1 Tax=Geodermatophilus maliterrae TaxID=3162531 RepID=A0ABV3XG81_9ACTN